MTDITITAAKVYPPDKTPYAQIIDQTGKRWGLYKERAGLVQQGGTYVITDHEEKEIGGKTYYTIKKFQTVVNGSTPPASSAPAAAPSQRVDDKQRGIEMAVCALMKACLENPSINPFDLSVMDHVEQLQKLRQAWLGVFGPSPLPRVNRNDPISTGPSGTGGNPNSDLNDDIPFGPEFR